MSFLAVSDDLTLDYLADKTHLFFINGSPVLEVDPQAR